MKKILFVILLGIISFGCKGQEVNEKIDLSQYLVIDYAFNEWEQLDEMLNSGKLNLIYKPLYYNTYKDSTMHECSSKDYLIITENKVISHIGDNYLFNFSDDLDTENKYSEYGFFKTICGYLLYSRENYIDSLYFKDNKEHYIRSLINSRYIVGYSIGINFDVIGRYISFSLSSRDKESKKGEDSPKINLYLNEEDKWIYDL